MRPTKRKSLARWQDICEWGGYEAHGAINMLHWRSPLGRWVALHHWRDKHYRPRVGVGVRIVLHRFPWEHDTKGAK